jgi:hypothetical protein
MQWCVNARERTPSAAHANLTKKVVSSSTFHSVVMMHGVCAVVPERKEGTN